MLKSANHLTGYQSYRITLGKSDASFGHVEDSSANVFADFRKTNILQKSVFFRLSRKSLLIVTAFGVSAALSIRRGWYLTPDIAVLRYSIPSINLNLKVM